MEFENTPLEVILPVGSSNLDVYSIMFDSYNTSSYYCSITSITVVVDHYEDLLDKDTA